MDHKWHGMDGLVAFMDYLQEKGIKHYALNHRGDDCVEDLVCNGWISR